ncbi:hypothetical protein [Roseomonas marmotae]|uniref:Lipoprotein n=1 Tax=Roseomonas marmotae TaxID=2768161 RepID=A0ABS3KFZ2_9PROT|nr:hypothetical protein [Roseomonas marmotae]MBO1075261.1 hypothetical protein [Roseomonas marmotae]QTI78246.1 hypothetical protein IAI58_11075 [Roseomonas marmotae]
MLLLAAAGAGLSGCVVYPVSYYGPLEPPYGYYAPPPPVVVPLPVPPAAPPPPWTGPADPPGPVPWR